MCSCRITAGQQSFLGVIGIFNFIVNLSKVMGVGKLLSLVLCTLDIKCGLNHPVLVPAVLPLLGKAFMTDIASFLGSLAQQIDSSRQEKSS